MSSIEYLPVVEYDNIGEISRQRTRKSIRLRGTVRAKPDTHLDVVFTSTDPTITYTLQTTPSEKEFQASESFAQGGNLSTTTMISDQAAMRSGGNGSTSAKRDGS